MIAFLCHPYHRGGVTRWMVDFAIECARNGEQVIFITVRPRKPFFSAGQSETIVSMLNKLVVDNIKVVFEDVGWEFELGTEAYRSSVYSRLLSANVLENAFVIVSDDNAAWKTSVFLGYKYRYVGVLHSDHDKYYELSGNLSEYFTLFVCVSQRIKLELLKRYDSIKNRPVFVIPCGINLPIYKECDVTTELRLVYVGRIINYPKRVYDIIDIAAKLKGKGIDFILNIVGDGPHKNDIQDMATSSGLADEVFFCGWRDQESIYEFLFNSDILLLASDFEGMPIVAMEALACGCSVVSTRVSGIEDYENKDINQGSVWLNSIGDTNAAVTNILMAADQNRGKRSCARNFAENEFDISVCYNRYKEAMAFTEGNTHINRQRDNHLSALLSYPLSFFRYLKIRSKI